MFPSLFYSYFFHLHVFVYAVPSLEKLLASSPLIHMIPSLQNPEDSLLSPHPTVICLLYVIFLTTVCMYQITVSELKIALRLLYSCSIYTHLLSSTGLFYLLSTPKCV